MPELVARVAEFISRSSMVYPGQRVGVAVSGGADSVCLLAVMRELAPRWNLALTVLHLDHRLRGAESDADREFVLSLAARFSLPVVAESVDMRKRVEATGDNLEQAAREARREFFRRQREAGRVDIVATGHTASDQAETVLFRFLRGAGTAGVSGIRPVSSDGIIRPLLEIDRPAIEAFLHERGLAYRTDTSNQDLGFRRNRIRHELLPQLARDWNPAIAEALRRQAELAQEEETFWDEHLAPMVRKLLEHGREEVIFSTGPVLALPRAVQRRLVRKAMELVKGDLRSIDLAHVDRVLSLLQASEGHGRVQAPGLDIMRSFDRVRIGRPRSNQCETRFYEIAAAVHDRYELPGSWLISLEMQSVADPKPGESRYTEEAEGLDWDRLQGSIIIRGWRPGDAYQPVGSSGEKKLKAFFQDARIPLWERQFWPVVTSGGQVVWSREFGVAESCRVTPETKRVLAIRLIRIAGNREAS